MRGLEHPAYGNEVNLTEREEVLYGLIVPEFQDKSIDPKEFKDLYGESVISRDLESIDKIVGRINKEEEINPELRTQAKRAQLFEAIIDYGIGWSDWLGDKADVIIPSEFDDVVNGVDSIVEFEEESSKTHIALAMDITKSSRKLEKKFGQIEESIKEGMLSKVKYFKSSDFRGELRRLPRVVIGCDNNSMQEIVDLFLMFKRAQVDIAESRKSSEVEIPKSKTDHLKKLRDQIASHSLQFKVLFEIQHQLEAFRNYASQLQQRGAAETYGKALSIIDAIIAEKTNGRDMEKISNEINQDQVYSMIQNRVALLSKRAR